MYLIGSISYSKSCQLLCIQNCGLATLSKNTYRSDCWYKHQQIQCRLGSMIHKLCFYKGTVLHKGTYFSISWLLLLKNILKLLELNPSNYLGEDGQIIVILLACKKLIPFLKAILMKMTTLSRYHAYFMARYKHA